MGVVRGVLGAVRGGRGEAQELQAEVRWLQGRIDGLERKVRSLEALLRRVERIEEHVGPLPEEPARFSGGMTMAEVRAAHPRADEVLTRHHLGGCAACAVSEMETLEQGAEVHQADVSAILRDLEALPGS